MTNRPKCLDSFINPTYDPIVHEIDAKVVNDKWKSKPAQRTCVRDVANRTLAQPSEIPIETRRLRAQKQVRRENNVKLQTVQWHCGGELFKDYENSRLNKWTRYFDQLLAEIEREREMNN